MVGQEQHHSDKIVHVPLSAMENLAIGSLGGALETTLQMPILTYKLCVQEGRPLPKNVTQWYRGVAIQAGTVAPITALQFVLNGFLSRMILGGEYGKRDLTDFENMITAAGAGALSATVYCPVDLVTIQQQKLHLNPIETIGYIYKKYGLSNGIFRGLMSCAVREAIYTAGYLGLAPVITHHLLNDVPIFHNQTFTASITGACIAGTASALATQAVDVSKTIMQGDISGKTHRTARDVLPFLMKEKGGFANIFRGVVPRTTRICGAFFICMSLRELAINYKTELHLKEQQQEATR